MKRFRFTAFLSFSSFLAMLFVVAPVQADNLDSSACTVSTDVDFSASALELSAASVLLSEDIFLEADMLQSEYRIWAWMKRQTCRVVIPINILVNTGGLSWDDFVWSWRACGQANRD